MKLALSSQYISEEKLRQYEDIEEKYNIKSFDDLEDRLTAIIILDRTEIDIFVLLSFGDYEAFATYQLGVDGEITITREEYDLLRRVFHRHE